MQNKDKKNDNQKVLVAIIIIVYFCLYCLFLTSFFIVKVNLNYLIIGIDDESLANALLIILLKRSPKYAKS